METLTQEKAEFTQKLEDIDTTARVDSIKKYRTFLMKLKMQLNLNNGLTRGEVDKLAKKDKMGNGTMQYIVNNYLEKVPGETKWGKYIWKKSNWNISLETMAINALEWMSEQNRKRQEARKKGEYQPKKGGYPAGVKQFDFKDESLVKPKEKAEKKPKTQLEITFDANKTKTTVEITNARPGDDHTLILQPGDVPEAQVDKPDTSHEDYVPSLEPREPEQLKIPLFVSDSPYKLVIADLQAKMKKANEQKTSYRNLMKEAQDMAEKFETEVNTIASIIYQLENLP